MLENKLGINAGQVNCASTAKSLKTQSFYSQVNSCQSTPASILSCRRRSGCVFSAHDLLLRGARSVLP